jgi:hypothetical protein
LTRLSTTGPIPISPARKLIRWYIIWSSATGKGGGPQRGSIQPGIPISTGWGPDANALADFLDRRHSGKVSPVPLFEQAWNLHRNPDVAASRTDPFQHFCAFGMIEGRDPSPDFDVKFYRTRYANELGTDNPLLHYLAHRQRGFLATRPRAEQLIAGAVRAAIRPGPDFETVQPIPASAPR